MSDLERERHKNAGLERARDSWYQEWFKGMERLAELEAENKRLRCCGNCRHSEYDGSWFGCEFNPTDDEGNDDMHPATQLCPFSPSEWQAWL